MSLKTLFCALALGAVSLGAGELSTEATAKLVKVVVNGAGGKIACRDTSMKTALEASGVATDSSAKVAWATSPTEAKMLKSMGKLVIAPRQELLAAGASVVITEEGGKPKILLHKANLAASGVVLTDAILKVGESL